MGRFHIVLKLISCYFSAMCTIYTCIFLYNEWHCAEAFCDAYLILCLYIRLNTTVYINGLAVSDRSMLLYHWFSTTVLWDFITLFPFDVSLHFQIPDYQSIINTCTGSVIGRNEGEGTSGTSIEYIKIIVLELQWFQNSRNTRNFRQAQKKHTRNSIPIIAVFF